jgi:hypothetical protein
MTRSGVARFEAEVAMLRDQLIEAVRDRRLSALDAGLEVFRELGEGILSTAALFDEQMSHRHQEVSWHQNLRTHTAADRLGPLSRALWPVVEEAVLAADSQLLVTILGTVNHLARSARLQEDVRSFADVVSLYPQAAARAVGIRRREAVRQGLGVADLAHHLLRLLPPVYSTGGAERDADPFALLVIKHSLETARFLIEVGDADELSSWAREYTHAERLVQIRDEARVRRLSLFLQAGVVALRGWILLSWQEPWRELEEEAAVRLFRALDHSIKDEFLWPVAVEDTEEALSESLGLDWWETGSRLDGEAHVMRFGSYRDEAVVLDLATRPLARLEIPTRDLDQMPLGELKRHARTAQRLKRQIDRLDAYVNIAEVTPLARRRLEEAMDRVTDALEVREGAQLAEEPLDDARVDSFAEAVLATIEEADSFAMTIPRCLPDDTVDQQVPPLFGVFTYAPKEFFVETDVYAEPASLGRNTGATVLRGEDRLLLDRLLEACSVTTLGEREIADVIKEELRRVKVRRATHVVVFGMFDWWVALREALNQREFGSGFLEPFEEGGVTYSFFPVHDANAILIADVPSLLCYERLVTPDDHRARGEIADLSVEPVTPEEARESASASTPGATESLQRDEEIRRLLKKVKIRVLVRPGIRVVDPTAGVIITAEAPADATPAV